MQNRTGAVWWQWLTEHHACLKLVGQKQRGKVCRLEVRVLLWHLLMSWFLFTTDTVQIAMEPNVLCLLTLSYYLLLYFIPHVLKKPCKQSP